MAIVLGSTDLGHFQHGRKSYRPELDRGMCRAPSEPDLGTVNVTSAPTPLTWPQPNFRGFSITFKSFRTGFNLSV